jgi:16S rRNA (cytosine967-C5)-methyltransferase
MGLPAEERIIAGLFFCSNKENELLETLRPGLNQAIGKTLEEKSHLFNPAFSPAKIFPWESELDSEINFEKFSRSFLIQPELFLRIRPGNETKVIDKLQKASIPFQAINDHCIELPNTSRVDQVIELDKEAVIQDLNSQRVGELLADAIKTNGSGNQKVWDCCAASGGKSIMAYDIDPFIQLTVSDLRSSIMINLRNRFEKAGIKKYRSFVADLTKPSKLPLHHANFDIVICDAPCTGSGTWGRTPEQLFFFREEKIKEYAMLQKNIISRVIPYIKPGGYLLYSTCSVFHQENKAVIDHIIQEHGMELKKQQSLPGYEIKADTLFAAFLVRPGN